MKRINIVIAMFLFTGVLFAQSGAPLSQGESQLNFGMGYDDYVGFPLYVGFDYAVQDDITIGASTAFDLGGFDAMNILVRGDYHWNSLMEIPSDWDFYTGVDMGGDIPLNKYWVGGFHFQVHIGGRYYFNDKWALHTEFGGGTGFSYLMGVSMRF
ncbi:MAG: hypothetical protein GXO47_13765 [Chlorobi bacterium]|nr:hypothetical protein [Chlorobiota bacterium]